MVMEIVGHSAIEMTMNVYGHFSPDTQRAELDALDDELGLEMTFPAVNRTIKIKIKKQRVIAV